MKVGIPREVKDHEYRVAITPAGVKELVSHGHQVFVEADADPALALGVNTVAGACTYAPVADAHGLDLTPLHEVLG